MDHVPGSKEANGGFSKQQRIRESCSACGSQKIRCTKERPSCERCVSKGLECIYDLSRRTGAKSIRDNLQSIGSSTPPAVDDVGQPDTFSEDFDIFMTDSTGQMEFPPDSQTDEWSFKMSYLIPDNDCGPYFNIPGFEATSTVLPVSGTGTSDHIGSLPSSDSFQSTSQVRPNFRRTQSENISTRALSVFGGAVQGPVAVEHHGMDCMAQALHTVMSLRANSGTCIVSSTNNMSNTSQPTHVRDIDTVLEQNKDAFEKLVRVLDCPCSHEVEVLRSVLWGAQKALVWYSAALDDDSQVIPYQVGSNGASERVASPPIFMGKYCLDAPAQLLVRSHLILSQLKEHAGPLMTRLQRLYPTNVVSAVPSSSSSQRPRRFSAADTTQEALESDHKALHQELNNVIMKANSIQKG